MAALDRKRRRFEEGRHWRKRLAGWLVFLLAVGIWQLVCLKVDNSLICPSPAEIVEQMIAQAQRPDFFRIVSMTVWRAMSALAISFAAGFAAAFASFFWKPAAGFFNAAAGLLQTVPNISYIILLLFWTGREQTVLLVAFFMLFPMVYRSLYEQLADLRHHLRDLWAIYPQPPLFLAFRICLPMMKASIASALKSASSVSFKVVVMTEILASISTGIGRSMQAARLDINVAGVLGWSFWLILLVFLFEKLWNGLLGRMSG